jgi:membrane protein
MQNMSTLRYYAKKFGAYHISTYAASASFFIITAIFPLLMLTMSIIGYTPLDAQSFLDMISNLIPSSFQPFFYSIAQSTETSSVTTLSVSLVATLWTAAKSMIGLLDGLNAIADVNDTRNFIFKRIICIGYMLILILGLMFNLALRVFGQHILELLQRDLPRLAMVFSSLMAFRGLTLFLVMALVFVLIYTFFPNKKMRVYMQVPGALFASLAWMGFSSLFSIYVNNFSSFSVLYGSLGMMIMVMLWLYFCMSIVFIGAVINRMYPGIFWRLYVLWKRHRADNGKSENGRVAK